MYSFRASVTRVHAAPLLGLVALLSACGSNPEPVENSAAVADEALGNVANTAQAAENAIVAATNAAVTPATTPATTPAKAEMTPAAAVPAAAAPEKQAAAGDAANGAKLFAQCRICHSVEPGKNGLGPSLHGVSGRAAGTLAGFNFSPAMKNSGVTWTASALSEYLRAPMKSMPGTKMAFAGMPSDSNRADVIAYLESLK